MVCRFIVFICLLFFWGALRSFAFSVTNSVPYAFDVKASTEGVVLVMFDDEPDAGTINSNTFKVYGRYSGEYAGSLETTGSVARFQASTPFRHGELITVSLSTNIHSTGGDSLAAATIQSWTTNLGSSYFQNKTDEPFSAPPSVRHTALGDFDADGDLDVYLVLFSEPDQIWWNAGNGKDFVLSGQALATNRGEYVVVGDFDGNRFLDVYVVGSAANEVWLNDGSGTNFAATGQQIGSENGLRAVAGDLDGDGDLDVFGANDGTNSIWLNSGSGIFTSAGHLAGSAGLSYGIVLGDLDGDRDLDAVIAMNSQNEEVWLNDGKGQFSKHSQVLQTGFTGHVTLGDANADGHLDLYAGGQGGNGGSIWTNDGAANFYYQQTLSAPGASLIYSAEFADLDGDGDLDIHQSASEGNQIWLNDGTGSFSNSGASLTGMQDILFSLSIADLDNDGDLDAVAGDNHVWLHGGLVDVSVSNTDAPFAVWS